VIELSSYQLETLTQRFIDVGVILNITPDHLDRYPSMEHYAAAKIKMENLLKPTGQLFVEEKCLKEFGHLFKSKHESYGYASINTLFIENGYIHLKGKDSFLIPENFYHKRSHDLENILASYALCHTFSLSLEEFFKGMASFLKPAHRIEFVRTLSGVNYYDDSKGTNIDAVIRAVESLEGKIVLIAGGMDKGFPYISWIKAFGDKVKTICAVGQSKEKIKADLEQHIPVILFSDFEKAVSYASNLAESGENVLLSPGCSSLDMFKDYAHRGQEFQRIVNAL
jgi:UDP-N-acetylmuramoylalanine--D-glutamate ligase